jgi:two-component system, NarL family, response regulator LiaR
VAVVNDYPLVAAGLASLLGPYDERVRVEAFAGPLPAPASFDIVLFDPFGHPEPEVRLTELVATGAPVVVFGWAIGPGEVRRARELGARGYLAKTSDAVRILQAIEDTAAGRGDWSAATGAGPSAGRPRNESGMPTWPGREHGLSERESEVLCLIARGRSNEEIAESLYLSINSIKTYIRSAYRKIGVQRRAQAVVWALDHGLRPTPD